MKPALASTLVVMALAAAAGSGLAEGAGPGSSAAAFVIAAQAGPDGGHAPVAGDARSPGVDTDRYGSLATGMPYDYEIRLGPNTKRVGVWRLQIVRFVTADGLEFTWRFDGTRAMDEFPLAAIAPAGIVVPAGARVSVNGEIPISP